MAFALASFSNIFAQQEAPAGAGDKNLQDNDIKMRSIEIDRIKREATKNATIRRDDGVELDFSVLKNDFEGIQKEQTEIIAGYQASDKIDYNKINKSSEKMTEMAIRLKANLFRTNDEAANDEKKQPKEVVAAEKEKMSVRDLIINLDNAIGDFVTNPMFANLKTIDPVLSEKAQSNLDKIIQLSSDLWLESKKLKYK